MQVTRGRRLIVTLAVAGLSFVAAVPAAQAQAQVPTAETGVWATNFPCTIVDYDLGGNRFVCVGSNDWAGTINGVTYYTMVGTLNPLTGETNGTIDERFIGAVGAEYGTLHLIEEFKNVGGMIEVNTKSIQGTGMLKDYANLLKFSGVWTLFTGGGGTFK